MTDKEQQIAEMAEIIYRITWSSNSKLIANALYDAHYRKVDVEKLTAVDFPLFVPNKWADDAGAWEAGFAKGREAQLAHTKREIGG